MFRHNNPYPQWTALGMGNHELWAMSMRSKFKCKKTPNLKKYGFTSAKIVTVHAFERDFIAPSSTSRTSWPLFLQFLWVEKPVLQRIWHFHVTKRSKEKKEKRTKSLRKVYRKFVGNPTFPGHVSWVLYRKTCRLIVDCCRTITLITKSFTSRFSKHSNINLTKKRKVTNISLESTIKESTLC